MSDVTSGAVLTLVVPLSLLVVIIVIWATLGRRWVRTDQGTPGPPPEP